MDVYEQVGSLALQHVMRLVYEGCATTPAAALRWPPIQRICPASALPPRNTGGAPVLPGLHQLQRPGAHEELGPPLRLPGAHAAGAQTVERVALVSL